MKVKIKNISKFESVFMIANMRNEFIPDKKERRNSQENKNRTIDNTAIYFLTLVLLILATFSFFKTKILYLIFSNIL